MDGKGRTFRRSRVAIILLVLCCLILLNSCSQAPSTPVGDYDVSEARDTALENWGNYLGQATNDSNVSDNELSTNEENLNQQRQINILRENWSLIKVTANIYDEPQTTELLSELVKLNKFTYTGELLSSALGIVCLQSWALAFNTFDADKFKCKISLQHALFYEYQAKQYAKELDDIVQRIDNGDSLDYITAEQIMGLVYNANYFHGIATVYAEVMRIQFDTQYALLENDYWNALAGILADTVGIDFNSWIISGGEFVRGFLSEKIIDKYIGISINKGVFKESSLGTKLFSSAVITISEWFEYWRNNDTELSEFDEVAEDNIYTQITLALQKEWNEAGELK